MSKEGVEDVRSPAGSTSHVEFRDRVRKTLYYGQYSDRSLPSLAVTDVAVDVLSSVVPTKRKCLDTNYAMVVSRRAKISPCTLMMGILYSERLRQKNPEYLRRLSSSDLFLISMMVASKYLYDEGEDEEVFNDDWAKAGSKTVNDVNKLEMEFLASIDWSLFISNQEFLDFVNKVESRVATTHGLCRGWFTYGDLCTLLDNSGFLQTLGVFRLEVLKVLCACTLAYVVSLSLALSLTSIASCHYQRTHQNFTPMQTPPCLTTETACRFHRPAVTHQRGKYQTSVTAKRLRGPCNESQTQVQIRTVQLTEQEQALQPMDIKGRLGPEKSKSDSPLACKWRPAPYKSKKTAHKSLSSTEQLKTHGDTPSLLRLSSLMFAEILSRKLAFQHPCPSTSSLDSFTGHVKNDVVFSNYSQGIRNTDWYGGHTNSSYICVG